MLLKISVKIKISYVSNVASYKPVNLLKLNFFARIFQIFSYILSYYLFFSRNRFLEGGFAFQWGEFPFQLGGASFFK